MQVCLPACTNDDTYDDDEDDDSHSQYCEHGFSQVTMKTVMDKSIS